MKYQERVEAISMRANGYSINEISAILGVSKSTVSNWVRAVVMTPKAILRLAELRSLGVTRSNQIVKERTQLKESIAHKFALENSNDMSILCALVYWCEGSKNIKEGVSFSNSDPLMIATFLKLFRTILSIKEYKLRICVHLHQYHNKNEILNFWSKVTRVPLSQFTKPYLKPNTGINKKAGYMGCIQVRYHDVAMARKLLALAKLFMQQYTSK